MEYLVVIPARCGSKRIPKKNIKLLDGIPLIQYTIDAAIESGVTSNIYVSTDCDDIEHVSNSCGAKVIKRPIELSEDNSSTESVLIHAINELRKHKIEPEWVITLPPTSPLRGAAIIKKAVDLVSDAPNSQDCLMTITEERSDFWLLDGNKYLSRLFTDAPRRQQDREPLWQENSALYITSVNALETSGSILGNKVRGLIITREEGWDINDELDFNISEFLIRNKRGVL